MFITSKNKYLSNDMKIFGTCSIPLLLKHFSYPFIKSTVCLNDDERLWATLVWLCGTEAKMHTIRKTMKTISMCTTPPPPKKKTPLVWLIGEKINRCFCVLVHHCIFYIKCNTFHDKLRIIKKLYFFTFLTLLAAILLMFIIQLFIYRYLYSISTYFDLWLILISWFFFLQVLYFTKNFGECQL